MTLGVFAIPRGAAEKKPAHGQPCTRCGVCCMVSLCGLAKRVFGPRAGPCPALLNSASGFGCGLVEHPEHYVVVPTTREAMRDAASHLIGAGTGCDARINGEPADVGFYRRLRIHDRLHRAKTLAAWKLWGVR